MHSGELARYESVTTYKLELLKVFFVSGRTWDEGLVQFGVQFEMRDDTVSNCIFRSLCLRRDNLINLY